MVFSNPPCHPTIVPANFPVATPTPLATPTPSPIRPLSSRGHSFWRCLAIQKPEPKIEPAAIPKK